MQKTHTEFLKAALSLLRERKTFSSAAALKKKLKRLADIYSCCCWCYRATYYQHIGGSAVPKAKEGSKKQLYIPLYPTDRPPLVVGSSSQFLANILHCLTLIIEYKKNLLY